jgi:hypothetical protein
LCALEIGPPLAPIAPAIAVPDLTTLFLAWPETLPAFTYQIVDVIEYWASGPAIIDARLELQDWKTSLILDSIGPDFPDAEVVLTGARYGGAKAGRAASVSRCSPRSDSKA